MDDAEGDIFQLQATAQGLSGTIESVNTRLDELDGDDRNLITHLPQSWEKGTISRSSGGNASNNSWVRLINYYKIKPRETLTLSSYEDYNVYIMFYDENNNYINYQQSGYDNGNTFTTPSDAKYFRATIRDRDANELEVSDIGTAIKAK